jgi:hypothetical protein
MHHLPRGWRGILLDVGPWMWVPVTVAAVAAAGSAMQVVRFEWKARKRGLAGSSLEAEVTLLP